MGMAASQARYLELTARKTNVEYEGQQVNQQRTALANQSAGLFSRLMGLTVPTPPSTTDYTTTQYTFSDGDHNYTITNMQNLSGDPNYNKTVTYYYTDSIYTGVEKDRTDLGVVNNVGIYWLTNGSTGAPTQQLTVCGTHGTLTDNSDLAALTQIDNDNAASANLLSDIANQDYQNIWKYTSNDGTTYYYSSQDFTNTTGFACTTYSSYAANISKKVYQTENANVTSADSGRYSTIKLASESATLDLNATTTTDENAYNDAMNEYEYQQTLYEQEVNSINARTSIIQQQDKTLELKLKQLDTEQEALNTEMEAVKKVIDKNIEQTFKTFSN
ncbi:MAG: hypothetical protein PHC64_02160 [Candidatus Gastranaerophilales bacterium]|nr:hypothetical protein [Candidatus Gastranaerophilales bacterium]